MRCGSYKTKRWKEKRAKAEKRDLRDQERAVGERVRKRVRKQRKYTLWRNEREREIRREREERDL